MSSLGSPQGPEESGTKNQGIHSRKTNMLDEGKLQKLNNEINDNLRTGYYLKAVNLAREAVGITQQYQSQGIYENASYTGAIYTLGRVYYKYAQGIYMTGSSKDVLYNALLQAIKARKLFHELVNMQKIGNNKEIAQKAYDIANTFVHRMDRAMFDIDGQGARASYGIHI